ncbi:hypothetical protein Glove_99g72 [Diversispora epigaea]|uniref:Phosphoribulokinase/uridine kinase domain-containing protein n=1 Tax=Diversispora epigaea TaxID=1348612 RepID=A0A397J8F3_9GLOM|nr:hypothetical protein Glove_99g72 [Diversispora epigaea]
MNQTYNSLANYLVEKLTLLSPENRYLVSIAGIPGSGKSTLSKNLIQRINYLMGNNRSIVIPMDGFHYSKKELTTFPNVEEAFARRGAHWTFDIKSLLTLIEKLRLPINEDLTINAPSFDHLKGDPEPDDIKILPSHKIILIEGLYLHLKIPMWNSIALHMDDTWFIHVNQEIAKERIIKRHIKTQIAENEEQAIFRIENNDMINADYILKNSLSPTRIIYSIVDDESNINQT